jgi:hypothetical protein
MDLQVADLMDGCSRSSGQTKESTASLSEFLEKPQIGIKRALPKLFRFAGQIDFIQAEMGT